MNYPYDFSKYGEIERYRTDFLNETPESQNEIREENLAFAKRCGEAANELLAFDYKDGDAGILPILLIFGGFMLISAIIAWIFIG